jgi:hypothetical protein
MKFLCVAERTVLCSSIGESTLLEVLQNIHSYSSIEMW